MPIKIRYRAPSGGGTLELGESATVADLFTVVKEQTGSSDITVKYGWPPKALAHDQADLSVVSLGLQRESLTIVTNESTQSPAASAALPPPSAPPAQAASSLTKSLPPVDVTERPITVTMVSGTFLVLRVMPDDNSCMFTAVAGALRGTNSGLDGSSPEKLRQIVTDHILANPETYNKVVLEKSPVDYCANMLLPDVWGGAIELGIISEVFEIEICVVNVKAGSIIKYGEGKHNLRCVLVWSNIHYDRIAEIFDESQVEDEFDVTTWNVADSDNILEASRTLCKKLKDEYHYFTDTSDFVVRCNQCGWIGQGEKAIVIHSSKTGHIAIEEILDST
ncbi:hypothetical protein BX600DRAFT_440400 [Xylariales sp. PMI_506]|nr:hypothetical protein BX600DRAFT_440400 [Xylariales sp. PMI_506]